jgi:predicted ester cyclase
VNKGKEATLAEIDEDFAADFIIHDALGMDIRCLKDFKQHVWSEFYDALPDAHFTVNDMVIEGDRAAVRCTITGTHKSALIGIPPTNKKVVFWETDIHRIANSKIVEAWQRFDTLGTMQ